MIDPHTGEHVALPEPVPHPADRPDPREDHLRLFVRAIEPPPVLTRDYVSFLCLIRGDTGSTGILYGDTHRDAPGGLFFRRREERPALDAALWAVDMGEAGAWERLRRLDGPVWYAKHRGELHFNGSQVITDRETVTDAAGVAHPIPLEGHYATPDEISRLIGRLEQLEPRPVPRVGRPPVMRPALSDERSAAADALAEMAADAASTGIRRKSTRSKAAALRRTTALLRTKELAAAVQNQRTVKEDRARMLEEDLLFWAARTTLEREFYLRAYVFGRLDQEDCLADETSCKREWTRAVHLRTDVGLAVLSVHDPQRADLFRQTLSDSVRWSSLRKIYRLRIEDLWPGVVRDVPGGGWEQSPLTPGWDGSLRPVVFPPGAPRDEGAP